MAEFFTYITFSHTQAIKLCVLRINDLHAVAAMKIILHRGNEIKLVLFIWEFFL